jgi:hypothetical protein
MPWVRRICSVAGTGDSLRDQPTSPRFGFPPFSRFPAGGGPKSKGFIHDFRDVCTSAGFRRKTESSRIRPGLTRFGSSAFLGWCAFLRSCRLAVRRRKALAFLQPGRPALQPSRVTLRAVPTILEGFRLRIRRTVSTLRSGKTVPRAGTTLPTMLFQAGVERRLFVPLQPKSSSCSDSTLRLLSETPSGSSRGRLQSSSSHKAGCPISPSSPSELASR